MKASAERHLEAAEAYTERPDGGAAPCPGPFELPDFTPYLIARVGSLMEQTITPYLKRAGLTLDMWRVLMVLHFHGSMTLVELSRVTGVTSSTLSRLVGRLIDQGLVSRRRSSEDSRTVQVRLRPKGEATFQRLWPTATRLEGLVTAGFGAPELARLKSALREIEQALLHELAAPKTRKDGRRSRPRKMGGTR